MLHFNIKTLRCRTIQSIKAIHNSAIHMNIVGDRELYDINVFEEHPHISYVAVKHYTTYLKYLSKYKLSAHTFDAFKQASDFVDDFYRDSPIPESPKRIILDSGVGRGMSTLQIALKNPHLPVIGIDKSIHRLSMNKQFHQKSPKNLDSLANEDDDDLESIDESKDVDDDITINSPPKNCLLLRANMIDFWLLVAHQSDWHITAHYILYPNPFPKSKHLRRRWHGHPVYPA